MALDRFGAEVFILLKRHGIRMQSVLTLGRQHFAVSPNEGATISGCAEVLGEAPDWSGPGEEFADPFFRALGAKTVDSLDASDYESCSRIHDLNEPIPNAWHAGYDVVFDGGTLEHVFHFPNAIANALNLVKEDGCFVTCTPCNNYNGHGFYQFSPELFFRLFEESRGFKLILIALAESRPGGRIFSVTDPAELGHRITFQGKGMLQLIVVAKKGSAKSLPFPPSPYQSDYSKTWTNSKPGNTNAIENSKPSGNFLAPIKKAIRATIPASWLFRYDQFRIDLRQRKEAMAGLNRVVNLGACFR